MAGRRNGRPDLYIKVWRLVQVPVRLRQGGTIREVLRTEPLADFRPWFPRWTLPDGFYPSKRLALIAAASRTLEAVTPRLPSPPPVQPVRPEPQVRTGTGAAGWGKTVTADLRQRSNDYRAELAEAKRRAGRRRLADVSGLSIEEALEAQRTTEAGDA